MRRQPTTRLQISGHRFLMRRIEHALVRGDARMLDDPLAAQSISLVIGAVLAVVAVAVVTVLAVLRPAGDPGDAPILLVRDSGAMYVRIDDRVHPVFNLASARLITGSPAEPRIVSQQAIDRALRGPMVGIPDAPPHLAPPLADGQWTVCDDVRSELTTVIAGAAPRDLSEGHSVLVTVRGEPAAPTYLLYGAWRARVDLRHPAVVRALRLDAVVPQPVSPLLLAAIPEAPEIVPPHIPSGRSALPDMPVGTVLRVPATAPANDDELFVVVAGGVQRIGQVAADLIRYTDSRSARQIPAVSADRIGALPVVHSLPVTTFPQRAGVSAHPIVCVRWDAGAQPHTALLTGVEPVAAQTALPLAQADGGGPALDAVAIPAGHGSYVRSVGLSGDAHQPGPTFLVSDAGVRYGVADADAAAALGLPDPPVPAPWPVLAALPAGPDLSRAAASVARDGVAAPP